MSCALNKDEMHSAELVSELLKGKLEHHGIKGMRWGIRRFQNKDGSLTPAGKKRYQGQEASRSTEDKGKVKTGSVKKKLSEMTDEELKARLSRLDMEQRYREYIRKSNPEAISVANRLLQNIANTTLSTIAKTITNAGISIMLDSLSREKK